MTWNPETEPGAFPGRTLNLYRTAVGFHNLPDPDQAQPGSVSPGGEPGPKDLVEPALWNPFSGILDFKDPSLVLGLGPDLDPSLLCRLQGVLD